MDLDVHVPLPQAVELAPSDLRAFLSRVPGPAGGRSWLYRLDHSALASAALAGDANPSEVLASFRAFRQATEAHAPLGHYSILTAVQAVLARHVDQGLHVLQPLVTLQSGSVVPVSDVPALRRALPVAAQTIALSAHRATFVEGDGGRSLTVCAVQHPVVLARHDGFTVSVNPGGRLLADSESEQLVLRGWRISRAPVGSAILIDLPGGQHAAAPPELAALLARLLPGAREVTVRRGALSEAAQVLLGGLGEACQASVSRDVPMVIASGRD